MPKKRRMIPPGCPVRPGLFLLPATALARPVDGRRGNGNANFQARKDKYKEQAMEDVTRRNLAGLAALAATLGLAQRRQADVYVSFLGAVFFCCYWRFRHGPRMAMTCGCAIARWRRPLRRSTVPRRRTLCREGDVAYLDAAKAELMRGLSGLLDKQVGAGTVADGAVVIGTPAASRLGRRAESAAEQPGQGRLSDPQRFAGRPCRHRHRRQQRYRRAVWQLRLSAADPDPPADRPSRHRQRAAPEIAAAESLGQSRRHHRARLCRPFHLRLAQDARLYGPAIHRRWRAPMPRWASTAFP